MAVLSSTDAQHVRHQHAMAILDRLVAMANYDARVPPASTKAVEDDNPFDIVVGMTIGRIAVDDMNMVQKANVSPLRVSYSIPVFCVRRSANHFKNHCHRIACE